jgi:hypothetical protein
MASDTPPPHQVRQDHRPPAARVQAALEQPVGRARHGPCQIRKRHGPCKQLQPALCVLPVPREGGHSPPSSRSDGDRPMRLLPLRQRRAALCHAAAMTHGNDPRRGRQTTHDHSRSFKIILDAQVCSCGTALDRASRHHLMCASSTHASCRETRGSVYARTRYKYASQLNRTRRVERCRFRLLTSYTL